MNHFTIRDIENLCGIKAHTLRTWEQRYGLCVARRKQSHHRIYDNDDLKELLRVSFLYHSGHKISRIAQLSPSDIHQLVQNACVAECNHHVFVHQLIEAGIDLDKEKFEKLVNCLVLRIGIDKCITEVFYPFLERIGLLWMTNHVVPAQEHFVSHIIRKKIILAADNLKMDPDIPARVLVFAPEGEHHEIPLLAINYFFRKHHNHTVYFGTNVSVDTIRYYLDHRPVEYIYAHVITHFNNQGLEHFMCSLCRNFPSNKILLSGPAARCMGNLPANLKMFYGLEEMVEFARNLGGGEK